MYIKSMVPRDACDGARIDAKKAKAPALIFGALQTEEVLEQIKFYLWLQSAFCC